MRHFLLNSSTQSKVFLLKKELTKPCEVTRIITEGNLATATISSVLQRLSVQSLSNLKSILKNIAAGEIKYGANFSPSLPLESRKTSGN
jgi:hypothetical protein